MHHSSNETFRTDVLRVALCRPAVALAVTKEMRFSAMIVAALVATVVASAADVAWGEAQKGVSLGIGRLTRGTSLRLYFRNETQETLYILTHELWWRCNLEVDGKRISREDDTKDLMLPPLALTSFTKVEAGAILEDSVSLSRWAELPEGDLRLSYSNAQTDGKEFGLKVWKGTVVSGPQRSRRLRRRVRIHRRGSRHDSGRHKRMVPDRAIQHRSAHNQ
jgi:hypothetical protein